MVSATKRNSAEVGIQEEIYLEKLNLLKCQLDLLENGEHNELNFRLNKLQKQYSDVVFLNMVCHTVEMEQLEKDYENQLLAAHSEFKEKSKELKDMFLAEVEEKRKQLEAERYTLDLTTDVTDVKPLATRKLRRRPNEPAPASEKRQRKSPPRIAYELSKNQIDEDVDAVSLACHDIESSSTDDRFLNPDQELPMSADSDQSLSGSVATGRERTIIVDVWVESGKLMYDKVWYQRGQSVQYDVEGEKGAGVLQSISAKEIWVKKHGEFGGRVKLTLQALQKGKALLKRK